MRIVFMGSPDFAVESLQALYEAGYEILLVLTQEDKAKGRHAIPEKTAVRKAAEQLGLPVRTTKRLREDSALIEDIRRLSPDFIVVAAFGQILPKEVLDIPRFCAVNVHASLLPKYRGASPIQEAILEGDKESGITTMCMAEGLDTGDILLQEKLVLSEKETAESLFLKLAALSRSCIVRTLEGISEGRIHGILQEESRATYTKIIKKKDGFINWNRDAAFLERMCRAYTPWPGAMSILPNGKRFKILDAEVAGETGEDALFLGKIEEEKVQSFFGEEDGSAYFPQGENGRFYCSKDKKRLYVTTGKGILEVKELQVEGKKRMQAADFLHGYPIPKIQEKHNI